jgi:hypothetical protein
MASNRTVIAVAGVCILTLACAVLWMDNQANQSRAALLQVQLASLQRTETGHVTVKPVAQRTQIEIAVIAKKAHIDDLTRQLQKYQQQRLDELKSDPVIAEMQKCIEPLAKEAEMKRSSPQAYSPDDILRANEAVFQERVRLAERQEQFAKDDQMIKWFQWEIMQQAADLEELRILADYTEERNHLFDSSNEMPPSSQDSLEQIGQAR